MKTYRLLKNALWAVLGGAFLWSCAEGNDFDYDKNVILISGTDVSPMVQFTVDDTPATYAVTASTTAKVGNDVKVKFTVDIAALDAYHVRYLTAYFAVPESSVEIENAEVVIPAGKTLSGAATVKVVSTEEWVDRRAYVIPISVQRVGGENLDVLEPSKTIFLKTARTMTFNSVDISNPSLYSCYQFELSRPGFEAIDLPTYTLEVKVLLTEDRPERIRTFVKWGSLNGTSNMLRFGEEGRDRNALQWVSPGGNVESTTLFSPNRWYTISLTYDGSRFTMYVDGVQDAELSGSKEFSFSKFEIGQSWAGYAWAQMIRGRMAEVRVWNRALVGSEIQTGLCGVDPNSEGLVGYWKMDEGEGHVFHDSSPNGLDMDWSDTYRQVSESSSDWTAFDKSSYVSWVKDDLNKCVQ